MIIGAVSCFPNTSQATNHDHNQMYSDVMETSSASGVGGSNMQLGSFLCSLAILKEKVHQVESLVSLFFPDGRHQDETNESTSIALASLSTLIQEIVVTASSMMFNCQQMTLCLPQGDDNDVNNNDHHQHPMISTTSHMGTKKKQEIKQLHDDWRTQLCPSGSGKSNNLGFSDGGSFFNWYVDNASYNSNNNTTAINNSINDNNSRMTITSATTTATTTTSTDREGNLTSVTNRERKEVATTSSSAQGYDIVELDAAALLAKYTHYCQVCGKGFKRDANLRMHMRAHGDEYKSSAALSNPLKYKNNNSNKNNEDQSSMKAVPRKYSCPHEGCKWNKNHAKFQPLKSMICVKNHYKRSHCPKMYVCKRCNLKQFSVLSDLRTHEKHCGDLKWQCSCGTTFSRKDKLMGHVALFVGHSPLGSPPGHSNDSIQSLQNRL